MNRVLERIVIWADENPIVFIVASVELLILFFIILQINERRRIKKIQTIEKNNAKMKNLDRRLANPKWLEREDKRSGKYHPYESEFHELSDTQEDLADTQVNLEINSPLVSQKYLVCIGEGITLGNGEDCEIVVADNDVAHHHCSILQDKKGILLKRIDEGHATVLERGRKFLKLSDKGIRLQSNDRINIGGSTVTINMISKG